MYWAEFLTIAIAHLFAVASPGPDFAVVLRQCVTGGTRAGIWTSLGVGSGILLHVSYCLLGVALLLTQSPAFFNAMKFVGAAYLIYLGVQSIKLSFKKAHSEVVATTLTDVEPRRAFVLGFLTNGLNPKATIFFLALFTVIIEAETPLLIQIFYGVYLAIATFCWFAMLSRLLGKPGIREFLLRSGVWFERGMGMILIFLAMQIVLVL